MPLHAGRWVVKRSFAWASRFRRLLAKDYERLPATVAVLHFVAFACRFLHRAITLVGSSPYTATSRLRGLSERLRILLSGGCRIARARREPVPKAGA